MRTKRQQTQSTETYHVSSDQDCCHQISGYACARRNWRGVFDRDSAGCIAYPKPDLINLFCLRACPGRFRICSQFDALSPTQPVSGLSHLEPTEPHLSTSNATCRRLRLRSAAVFFVEILPAAFRKKLSEMICLDLFSGLCRSLDRQ